MPKQINKQPHNWSDEDLQGWANGDVELGSSVSEEKVAEEVFKRANVEEAGGVEEAKALLVTEQVTEEEAEPVEQEEPVEEVKAPEPEPTPAPTPKPTPVTQEDEGIEIVEDQIQEYIDRMYPGNAHRGNEGAMLQVKLYRTIQTVLRMEGRRFITAYSLLLKMVNENRDGVFNERYVFRYFDALNITNPERRNFERILNLLLVTCDPKTRAKATRQVDIELTMEGFRNPEMYQRITEFYNGV